MSPSRTLNQSRRDPDAHLPAWARRSNPIVRRHLGPYWKTMLPEVREVLRRFAWQAGLLLLSWPLASLSTLSSTALPFLTYIALLPVVFLFYSYITASALALIFAFGLYGYALFAIGAGAGETMLKEQQSNTLLLLRTTPFSLRDIFLGHIAASIWRQADNLDTIISVAGWFSLFPLFQEYVTLMPSDHPLLARLAMVLALAVSLIRLVLEPLMVGALGIAVGAAAQTRITALIMTAVLTLFYFLLINLPRLLPLAWSVRLLVEIVLPLALPLLILWGAFCTAAHVLRLDR